MSGLGNDWETGLAKEGGEPSDYRVQTIRDLLVSFDLVRDYARHADRALLDALVDIINRSPFPVAVWAWTLGFGLQDFIATCHYERAVDWEFRERVRAFFDPYRDHPYVRWGDLPMKSPPQTPTPDWVTQ